LTARLYSLRAQKRTLLVEFLACLGELDRRRLHLELGFPSTFAFCTDYLGLTKSSTFRRLTAARLLVQFPTVAECLADGRLGLTTLVELRDVLCDETLAQTLDRAAGKTEEEVKALAAALKPQPAPPDLLRRLPERQSPQTELSLAPVDVELTCSGPEPTPAPKPARIEPISEELRVLRMTVGRQFVDDLENVRDALSHIIPDRRLESVLHECIRRTLRECSRRRGGGTRQPAKPGAKRTRHVPAAVRAEVTRRDGGRCAFVASDGHRCGSTYQLEFHHIVPFARGGCSTVDNLALRCRAHNGHEAEKEYGAGFMADRIGRSRHHARGAASQPSGAG